MYNSLLPIKHIFYFEYFLFFLYFKTINCSSICDEKSSFYGLYLNTSYNQDYEQANISIFTDCTINKYWKLKTGKEENFHIHKPYDNFCRMLEWI